MRSVFVFSIVLSVILLSSCKSNLEAYKTTYLNLKEKQDEGLRDRIKTTMPVKVETQENDSLISYKTEVFTLVSGKETDLSDFNVVNNTFLNKTNATAYYERMLSAKFPAVLVQNQDQLYRIVVGAFATAEEAEKKKIELLSEYPKTLVVIRKKP